MNRKEDRNGGRIGRSSLVEDKGGEGVKRGRICREYQGYIFDLDGVLWQGSRVIEGAVETVKRLQEREKKCLFVSNTSTQSFDSCLKKIKKMGFPVDRRYLYVATRETARYIAAESPGSSAYVIGTPELIAEIEKGGIRVFSNDMIDIDKVKYVVVGNDRSINYSKLNNALHAIRAGARLAAVNNDLTTPDGDTVRPAGGAIVAAVAAMTGQQPVVNIGKPKPYLLEKALAAAGLTAEDCVLIGDTIETDIAAGRALGMDTILVLSGNTSPDILAGLEESLKPTYVIESIAELK